MIVVNARIQASEDDIRALTPAILEMQSASRIEDGCEDYTFSVEMADPTVLRITERWVSQAALLAHFATPHMAAFQQAMQQHPPGEVSAHFYEAVEVEMPR